MSVTVVISTLRSTGLLVSDLEPNRETLLV